MSSPAWGAALGRVGTGEGSVERGSSVVPRQQWHGVPSTLSSARGWDSAELTDAPLSLCPSSAEEASAGPAAAGEAQAWRVPCRGCPGAAAAGALLRWGHRCGGAAWAAVESGVHLRVSLGPEGPVVRVPVGGAHARGLRDKAPLCGRWASRAEGASRWGRCTCPAVFVGLYECGAHMSSGLFSSGRTWVAVPPGPRIGSWRQ